MVGETHFKVKDGLWILRNGEEYCVGLTSKTQGELGHVTYAALPKVGQTIKQGEPLGELEAEKSVSEFSSPLTGKIYSVNESLEESTDILDSEEELDAWLLSFKNVDLKEFENL